MSKASARAAYGHHKRHLSKHYAGVIHYHARWGTKVRDKRRKQALIDRIRSAEKERRETGE